MTGKDKCKILKEIRQKIADENDIPYITEECSFKGNCKGTCPKCESELRYLEKELEKRKNLGKKVAVAGLAASMVVSLSGCVFDLLDGPEIAGDIAIEEPQKEVEEELTGEVAEEECEVEVLEGDVAYVPDETEELEGKLA